MDVSAPVFDTEFNVVSAFRSPGDAEAAIEMLADRDVPRSAIAVHRRDEAVTDDEIAEERAEMQDELGASWTGPGIMMSGPQARGALNGVAIFGGAGLACGILAGVIWGYAFDSAMSGVGRVMMSAYITALGGAVLGFVASGGLAPRLATVVASFDRDPDDGMMVAERDVLVAVHTHDQGLAEQAAVLLRANGAERVDFIDRFGTPLPPQAAHPRPADPAGWWWGRAGCG